MLQDDIQVHRVLIKVFDPGYWCVVPVLGPVNRNYREACVGDFVWHMVPTC